MPRRAWVAAWCVLPVLAWGGCAPKLTPASAHIDVQIAESVSAEGLTIEENESVTLSASVDGRTEGYAFRWEVQGGPGEVEIDDPTSPVIEAGPFVVLGSYKLRVYVSTTDGRFGQAFIVVTVEEATEDNENAEDNQNANENGNENENDNENANENDNGNENGNENDNETPPDTESIAARINAPAQMAAGLTAPLGAISPGADLETEYQWSIVSGEGTIEDPTAQTTAITATAAGLLEVRLVMRVFDLDEEYEETVMIDVQPVGTFTVFATASPNRTQFGVPVTLDSSATNADVPVGGRVVHEWTIVEGAGSFSDAGAPDTEFTPGSFGVIWLRVTAETQPGGVTATDEVQVFVETASTIELEGNAENLVLVGEPTELSVEVTNFPVDDVTLSWSAVGGDATIADPTALDPTVTVNSAGTATLTLAAEADVAGVAATGTLTIYATSVSDLHPQVNIAVEQVGQIPIELNGEAAPITVANFLHYVDDRGYDGLTFHRVIPDFVVQGGGHRIEGGEYVEAEPPRDPIPNESDNGLSNVRGTLSMALLSDQPDSGDRQFFINLTDENTFLDEEQFTVFGEVTGTGMVVADAIAGVERDDQDRPIEPVVITSIRRVEGN